MNDAEIVRVPLDRLRAHPMNSNVMPERQLRKLVSHLRRTGRYPPLIVRRCAAGDDEGEATYQVLDGHHRWEALRRADHAEAACVVWDADDDEALVLLSTLNRLRGDDDPLRRASLIETLRGRLDVDARQLARLLPESAKDVTRLLALNEPPPRPAPPRPLRDMPTVAHFFLTGEQKLRLDAAIQRASDGCGSTPPRSRETALMHIVDTFTRVTEAC